MSNEATESNEQIEQKGSRIPTIITKFIFVPTVSFAFTLLGAIITALSLANQPEDGFKNLGDFLGGVFVGALAGLIISIVMIFKLNPSRLRTGIAYAVGGIVLEIVFIYFANVYNIW